jgi:hypothetical protein
MVFGRVIAPFEQRSLKGKSSEKALTLSPIRQMAGFLGSTIPSTIIVDPATFAKPCIG